jgi:hypothetical protein
MATIDTKLYVALGVLAVLGGALYVADKKEKEEARHYTPTGQAAELPKLEIKEADTKAINRITLTKPAEKEGEPAQEVVLVKVGEEWQLDKPVKAPANQANVKSLIDNLPTLKASELIDPGKTAYDKYGVSDKKGLHAVFSKDGGTVLDAYFGESGGRGQMTRIAGKDGVFSVKGYSSYLYSREPKGWRDMALFKFEEADVTHVSVTNEHGVYEFAKDGEKWTGKYAKPKGAAAAIEKFDENKVKDLVRAYRSLNADDYAAAGKTAADLGLDKPNATLILTMKDGGKKQIDFGSTAEGTSRWIKATGKDEFFSVSSWAADWAFAEPKKFQEADKSAAPAAPANPHGMPGMPPGMPPGMGDEPPH